MPRRLTPHGAVLRQSVLLRRYENTAGDKVAARLAVAKDRIVAEILARPLDDVSTGRMQRRLDSILTTTNEHVKQAYRDIHAFTKTDLADVGMARAGATAKNVQRFAREAVPDISLDLALPSRAKLATIIASNPMEGYPLKDWWGKQAKDTQAALRKELTIGATRGETIAQMVVRIRGSAVGRGRYEGGVMQISTRNAEGVARTAVNFISNQATILTFQENADVVSGAEFCATLDERTCEACADLDGESWGLDDPKLQTPPIHINDRCTLLPVILWAAIGAKPPKTEPRQTYPEWFDAQHPDTQDAILGPGRAKLVRAGTRTFSDLVRSDGTRVPLKHLIDDDTDD